MEDINSNENLRKRNEQSTFDICQKRFGIIADPRFSMTANANYLARTTTANNLPKKIQNLQCHNLCQQKEDIPADVLDTLGLNLSFGISLPPKKDKLPIDFERLQRSVRLCFTKFDKKQEEVYVHKLKSRSDWEPEPAPKLVEDALNRFKSAASTAFQKSWKKPHVYNLEKCKIDLLREIKKNRKYIIIATDKNLGPAIMEIDYYIYRCLTDHLDDKTTYKELSSTEAHLINYENFRFICKHFIDDKEAPITEQARKFFANNCLGFRNLDGSCCMKEGVSFPYFYMMPKMHKKPDWKTRPVVSGVTSPMRPLSIWLDCMLQSVVHLCPCYLKDSWHLLNDLKKLKNLKGYKLVTLDANAFYTNINTQHAINILERWFILHAEELPEGFPVDLVLLGIRRLMEFNVFTFGNRFFLQINGTAMGTNVACMYATIYYSYHEEMKLIHLPYVIFYRRLIDDAFLIVKEDTQIEDLAANMDDFGPAGKRLTWETEPLLDTVNFLDLTITIETTGRLTTKTFQKTDNKHLYRTPNSCQPQCTLRSFVYSSLHRYFWQNTYMTDYTYFAHLLYDNMLVRGHTDSSLTPIFKKQSIKAQKSAMPIVTRHPKPTPNNDSDAINKDLYIHIPHHPNNPTTDDLRNIANTLKEEISPHFDFNRVMITYSKAPNIGDICKKHQLEDYIDTNP